MCGIAGIISGDPNKVFPETVLVRMRDCMQNRGPDDAGLWQSSGAAMLSRRLSILDLSPQGHMPMETPDGRYVIVHNGEIYNYQDFYPYLKSKGWKFRSTSDTEVLLYLFAQDGPAMLDKLNGMFSFAIWDKKNRKIFAARDRMGVKPFYYSARDGFFYFASEEKALFEAGVSKNFEPAVSSELLLFRYIAGENTSFKGVRRLLPGHFLTWENGTFELQRWWKLSDKIHELRARPVKEPAEWFQSVFDDAVKIRKISDVPVGVLLSGGLDSSSVAASLAVSGGEILQSFTVGFEEKNYDERLLARQVSARYGMKNHEYTVSAKELPALLESAIDFQGGPPAHASDLHLLAIARYAKKHVTVLLSGEGGDETLGGYNRYLFLKYNFAMALAAPFLPLLGMFSKNTKIMKLQGLLEQRSSLKRVMFSASEIFPRDLGKQLEEGFSYREKIIQEAETVYPGDYARQAMYYDQHSFLCSILDRNDRMTMGASIECRTPFLDYRLVEGLAALPSSVLMGGKPKQLLRKSLGSRLPKEILSHRKWGFGVPWGKYMRTVEPWREEVHELSDSAILKQAGLDPAVLSRSIKLFESGDVSSDALIYQCFILHKWYKRIFNNK